MLLLISSKFWKVAVLFASLLLSHFISLKNNQNNRKMYSVVMIMSFFMPSSNFSHTFVYTFLEVGILL